MAWKYLEYPSKGEATDARNAHFSSNPGNPCRQVSPGTTLAYKGEFGGPRPAKPPKNNNVAVDAAVDKLMGGK